MICIIQNDCLGVLNLAKHKLWFGNFYFKTYGFLEIIDQYPSTNLLGNILDDYLDRFLRKQASKKHVFVCTLSNSNEGFLGGNGLF